MSFFSNLLGNIRDSTFRIGRALLDSSALSAVRTQKVQDRDGTLSLDGIVMRTAQTAAYTFVLADANACTPFNLSAAANATIPPNSSVAFPVGTLLYVKQAGTAAVTFVAGSGVTLNVGNSSASTGATNDWLGVVQTAANTWDVVMGRVAGTGANLSTTTSATTLTVNSDTGTDAVLPAATDSVAGVLTATDKTKLDGIASGAQVNAFMPIPIAGDVTSSTNFGAVNQCVPYNSASAGTFTIYKDSVSPYNANDECITCQKGAGSITVTGASGVTCYPTSLTTTAQGQWIRAFRLATDVWTLNLLPGAPGGGSGTVTSVGLSAPSWLAVSGSPVTASGTLALSAAGSQSANQVLATPDGSSGSVGLRALTADDLPTMSQASVTASGTTQSGAAALSNDYNLGTTNSGNQAFVLPTAAAGKMVRFNHTTGSQDALVFPASGAKIGSLASNASLTVPLGFSVRFIATSTTQWYSSVEELTDAAALTGTLQAAQFPALTGDVTTAAGGLATTLATSGVTAGTYGDSGHAAKVTVDAKGRVTAASSQVLSNIVANVQTGTTYTLVASDAGAEVQMNNASANTLTVDASVFSAGDYILVRQTGAGQTTIAGATSPATTITKGGATLKALQQGSLMYVRIDSSSTAYAGGEVAAS